MLQRFVRSLGIEVPIGDGCRRSIKIEGLYDIVFVSQAAWKYKSNTQCVIGIEAPRHHGVNLVFTHMDLQAPTSNGTCVDYVQVGPQNEHTSVDMCTVGPVVNSRSGEDKTIRD